MRHAAGERRVESEGGARSERPHPARAVSRRSLAFLALVAAPCLSLALPRPVAGQGVERAEQRALGTRVVRGVVTDAETGRPVEGAEVLLDGGAAGRLRTDEAGRWELSLGSAGAVRLRVRHPGFAYRDVDVSPRDSGNTVYHTALTALAIPLDAVIVTAARREQRLADAVVETELIGERELRRTGASDVAAVLTERSGLQLDGGVPAGSGAQMRGFDSRRVLVLLDGQPLVGRVNGNFDLSRIPTSMVERIEVVKGPQSTLYGSDALGGVINIITRRATRAGMEAGVTSTAGTQGRRELSGNGAWRRGAFGGTIDAGVRRLDLAPGVAGDDDTFAHRWNAASALRWQLSPSRIFEASILGVGEQQRYRTGQLFHFADNTQLAARAGGQFLLPNGRLSATLHLSSFEHLSRASLFDRPASDSGATDTQRLVQGDFLYNAVFGRAQVDAGVQLRREGISADRLSTTSPHVASIEPFAQATFALASLSVTPGLRVSASDRWGRFVAPRLAAMWRPAAPVAVRASVGRGFRAPDFKELYLDFVNTAAGYAVRGNADLRPESSTSWSLGAEWTGTHLWGRVGGYRNDYRDFIETREPDASGTYTYSNIARGRTSGVEVEGGVVVADWRLDGSYDWLRARDQETGGALLGRPSHTARAAASGPLGFAVRGTLSALYTGRTPLDRVAGAVTRERAGWTRVDARLTRPLPGGAEASLGVTNLFDRELLTGWPGFTGRQLFGGITWKTGGAR